MTIENSCIICNASLINRRSHAKTCSCRCRTALSRLSRAKPVSLKLVFSKIQFDSLKLQADSLGILVNELAIDRVTKPFTNVGVTTV